jgi:hypothetical protein
MPTLAALAVSVIYCVWQSYQQTQQRRRKQLRERVAYLLWTAASRRG